MRPSVLVHVTPEMKIAPEEMFGALCVPGFDHREDAIRIVNGTRYGLAAGIFTGDVERALWAAERLEEGQAYVNGKSQ